MRTLLAKASSLVLRDAMAILASAAQRRTFGCPWVALVADSELIRWSSERGHKSSGIVDSAARDVGQKLSWMLKT